MRIAGVDPAVDVGADQGADPLLVGVVEGRAERRLHPGREVAVGGPLGGEGLQIRQPQQPHLADLLGGEAGAVGLQQVQTEDGVVHVVVTAAAVDPAADAALPLGAQRELHRIGRRLQRGEVAGQRQGVGAAQIPVDAVAGPGGTSQR
ncbi:hypothetical protein ADL28_01635 [Streptomyces violaceusniger]|uniref:Uncharacterized protein n=1 Tax=Streptomyces violaceusniger TaxID=68280 RepID=A0A0X3XD87_STRVO|nr:hypothetical protein ADL28_01635 [Streptomyces violaceusniger]